MRRREFITLIGGAAAWPLSARAQQGDRVRRIGVLMNLAADDPELQARMIAFMQALQQSGWTNGANVRIDVRWAAADPEAFRRYASRAGAGHYPRVDKPKRGGLCSKRAVSSRSFLRMTLIR